MVKNLGPQIRRIRHVSGATLLCNGGVSLLLNVVMLVRSKSASGTIIPEIEAADGGIVLARRVLVVDDSVTTRSLMKGILESSKNHCTISHYTQRSGIHRRRRR
ncbi:MAG: hypothetical protein ACKVHE_20215 [Planctomycetales bacterium]